MLSHYGEVLENDYPLCTDSWFRDTKLLNSNQELIPSWFCLCLIVIETEMIKWLAPPLQAVKGLVKQVFHNT